jgi:hypothetical protein
MSLRVEDVQRVVREHKLSVFCASCTRYWEARERGIPGHRCTSTAEPACCSPLAGGEFGDYQGPITDTARWCFVCGAPEQAGVHAAGKAKVFGVCAAHLRLALQLQPEGKEAPFLLVRTHAELVPAESLRRQPKPSRLAQTMRATQEEWDHEMRKHRG